jgi:HSP20 family protein
MSEEKYLEGVPSYSGDTDRLYEIDPASSPRIELAKAGSGITERRTKNEADVHELGEGVLTLDVYRTPTEVIVESAIAGVNPEDIDIDITPDSITIRGERRRTREAREKNYDLQECYWGRFSRSIILPEEVDADSAKAEFQNGILTVRMPKRTRTQSKKLRVSPK